MAIFNNLFCNNDLSSGSDVKGLTDMVECIANEFLNSKEFLPDDSCYLSDIHFISIFRIFSGSSRCNFLGKMIKFLPFLMSNIVSIFAGASLFVGSVQTAKVLLRPWLIFVGVHIILFVVTANAEMLLQVTPVAGRFSNMCFTAILVYAWVFVFDHYQNIEEADEPNIPLQIVETDLHALPSAPIVLPIENSEI